MADKSERDTIMEDHAWWERAANVIGMTCTGWTFRNIAAFFDKETGTRLEVSTLIATRLHAVADRLEK